MFNKSRKPMTMHQATCDECGRSCQVPFKPSGDKPVFCSDCFEGKEDSRPPRRDSGRSGGGYERRGSRDFGGGRRDSGRRDYGRDDRSERRMYQAVCDKCGNACEVPFQPTSGKPIFCDQCFGKNERGGRSSGGSVSPQQFEELNAKLDKILKLLNPAGATEKAVKTEKVEKKIEKKEKAVKKEVAKEEVKEVSKATKVVKKTAKKATAKATKVTKKKS